MHCNPTQTFKDETHHMEVPFTTNIMVSSMIEHPLASLRSSSLLRFSRATVARVAAGCAATCVQAVPSYAASRVPEVGEHIASTSEGTDTPSAAGTVTAPAERREQLDDAECLSLRYQPCCRCCTCGGDGRLQCRTCQGYRQLKCYIKLTVKL